MPSLNLSKLSEQFEGLNQETQEFANGLIRLARAWRGDEGVAAVYARVNHNLSSGLPIHESLIEVYQFVRSKLL